MKKPDSLQGTLDLLVLKILSRRPGLHGYALMTAITEMSQDVLRAEEGTLYPALHRMEEAGWIRARWRVQSLTGLSKPCWYPIPLGMKKPAMCATAARLPEQPGWRIRYWRRIPIIC
jgi:hypothetical protein